MTDRNLGLSTRTEGIRDKIQKEVVKFDLDQIMQHFNESIDAIKILFTTADNLLEEGKESESTNIWRFQIVFLASALDFYMHEITKYGLCEIFSNKWERTQKYKNIHIKLEIVDNILKSTEDEDWFLDFVNSLYEKDTMISYESVKKQLNLLGVNIESVARKAFYKREETEKPLAKLERRLKELFIRRNIIAHQSDRAHANAQVYEITKDIVDEYITDIEKIIVAINNEASSK
jgi:hypothetical protein